MCLNEMRGMTSTKSSRAASRSSLESSRPNSNTRTEGCNDNENPMEVSSVSYLTVPPSSAELRRPSTADVFIEKLKVERMEGGGLSISGVALASNCHLSLIIFGAFFLMAGIVLTYVGFASGGGGVSFPDVNGVKRAARTAVQTNGNMQVIGPSFVLAGVLMLLLGFALFGLSKKIHRDEKEQRKALSELQLCQMENNFNVPPHSPPHHTIAPSANEPYPVLSVRRGSYWMDAMTEDLGNEVRTDINQTAIEPQVPPLSSGTTSPTPYGHQSEWTSHQGEMFPHLSQDNYSSPRTPHHIKSPGVHHLPASEYYHNDIATFPQEDTMDSRVPTAVQSRRDIEQTIPYEYYQPQHPVQLPTALEQAQHDTLLQYQQIQAQRQQMFKDQRQMSKDQIQWKGSAGTRHVPQIQVTSVPSAVVLPRLSRHSCSSSRPDSSVKNSTSRPTTAEAR